MVPIGHYRDLDDPDSFVWFRGFADRETRLGGLEAFYTSRAWVDHRDAANATMIDSDNVLLLRSARPGSGFETQGFSRPAGADLAIGRGRFVVAAVLMLGESATEGLVAAFEEHLLPELRPSVPPTRLKGWLRAFDSGSLPEILRLLTRGSELLRLEPAPRSLFR